MKIALLLKTFLHLLLLLAFHSVIAKAELLEPMTCNLAGILEYVAMEGATGDTVLLPACSPTNWDDTFYPLDISSNPITVMLEGQPCTIGDSGKTDALGRAIMVPTSCPTNIVDNAVSDDLVRIDMLPCAHPCDYQGGVRNISFTSTGQRTFYQWGVFNFNATSSIVEDGRRVKIENLRLVGISGSVQLFKTSEWGVMSGVYLETPIDKPQIMLFHQAGGPSYSAERSDARLSSTSVFGREDAFTIERSVFISPSSGIYNLSIPLTDSVASAARIVVRDNYIDGFNIQTHGIESGWLRGPHYMEVYRNKIRPYVTGESGSIHETRSGGVMVWGNVMDAAFAAGTPMTHAKSYRHSGQWSAYNETSGVAPLDENDPGNPLVTCTTNNATVNVGAALQTVTCDGVSWTPGEHAGKLLYQAPPDCMPRSDIACGIVIFDNDSDTLEFPTNFFAADPSYPESSNLQLAPGGGDTIYINSVVSTLDSPCRYGGTLFGPVGIWQSITYNSGQGLATLTAVAGNSMASLGIATNDYVVLEDSYWAEPDDFYDRPYRGTYQVTVTGTHTFTFTPHRPPTGSSPYGSEFKKRILTSSAQSTSCYEFLNFDSSGDAIHISTSIPNAINPDARYVDLPVSGLDANPIVFNWVGTSTTVGEQISSSSPFNGTVGVGVGTKASPNYMPATCTVGVFYWATDEGEWDSTNGATPDGRGYKCTATNTWTLVYTPLAVPHPLLSGLTLTSITPSTVATSASLNNAALAGVGFSGANLAFASSQAGLTFSDIQVTNDTTATMDIAAAANAYVGTHSIHFTTDEGTSTSAAFTVTGGADTTPPVPGNSGAITTADVWSVGLTLNWAEATDAVTAQEALETRVYISASNNLGPTVADVESNGTPLNSYTADLATLVITGLTPSTSYYFNLIVKDEAGNKVIYTTTSETTAADTNPPTIPGLGGGEITTSSITPLAVTLSWNKAHDEFTQQPFLVYEVRRSLTNNIDTVANAEANGTIVLAYTNDIDSAMLGGLTPNTSYYFNVIVRDLAGNKTAYTQVNASTPTRRSLTRLRIR